QPCATRDFGNHNGGRPRSSVVVLDRAGVLSHRQAESRIECHGNRGRQGPQLGDYGHWTVAYYGRSNQEPSGGGSGPGGSPQPEPPPDVAAACSADAFATDLGFVWNAL